MPDAQTTQAYAETFHALANLHIQVTRVEGVRLANLIREAEAEGNTERATAYRAVQVDAVSNFALAIFALVNASSDGPAIMPRIHTASVNVYARLFANQVVTNPPKSFNDFEETLESLRGQLTQSEGAIPSLSAGATLALYQVSQFATPKVA